MCREVTWVELTAEVTSVPLFRRRALGFCNYYTKVRVKNWKISLTVVTCGYSFFLL